MISVQEKRLKAIQGLSIQQLVALYEQKVKDLATAKKNDIVAWQPDPDNHPQCAAYHTEAFETLYGGAAGGGKSELILGLARTQHTSSLLLRREFPELERSLIERSLKIYGDRDNYNASKHVWRIGEQRIEFGHLERAGTPQRPGDESQYASAQYDFIAFDQLEQFPRYVYEFLISRARTTKSEQRVRIVSSANFVGENVEWLLDRWGAWLDDTHERPAKDGEIRYYKRDEKGKDVETTADDPDALSRTFISARLADNKYIDEKYRRQLASLPEPLRGALLYGNVKASIQDDAWQVIPRAWVKAAQERWKNSEKPKISITSLGVDVARGGDDKTVLAPLRGDWFDEFVSKEGFETPDGQSVVALIAPIVSDNPSCKVNIDVIGVGSSVYDLCKERFNANPIGFGEKSTATDKSGKLPLPRVRDEAYWKFREALDPELGNTIALPPDQELENDLCAAKYNYRSNGIKIEDKEDIKARIGRSPDKGDACVLAWFRSHEPPATGFTVYAPSRKGRR